MKTAYKQCPICQKTINAANFERHVNACERSSLSQKSTYKLDHEDLFCKFCKKECKNKNSLIQHELRCKQNPTCILRQSRTCKPIQGFNNVGRTPWNKGLTKATDERVAKHAALLSEKQKGCKGKPHTKEEIDKMMRSYQRTLKTRVETVKHKYKFGTFKGIRCDSAWELAFIVHMTDKGFSVQRNFEGFPYQFNDKIHYFYPDFLIEGEYYEVKGIFDEKTVAKLKIFCQDHTLHVIGPNEIEEHIRYCKNTYGNDFDETLYDKDKPSWNTI